MTSFSELYGYKPAKSAVQIEAMDNDLRISLWNALESFYWSTADTDCYLSHSANQQILSLLRLILYEHLKLPIDKIGNFWEPEHKQIKEYFFSCRWNEVIDFIQFVANHYYDPHVNEGFKEECNRVLKREVSGYRFAGDIIVQITSEEEIAEIEEVLQRSESTDPIAIHLKSALDCYSDRQSPDYRNSIKESVSAVEAMCDSIVGKDKAKLGEALKIITDKVELHPALRKAFSSLYGYTSDADGIRHALLEESKLDAEDAKFMLVACSAFINYLRVKVSKAEITEQQ